MTFESFVDVYKDKSPVEKLDLLVEQVALIHQKEQFAYEATIRGNREDHDYYVSEADHMRKRAKWLYDGLADILKSVEKN